MAVDPSTLNPSSTYDGPSAKSLDVSSEETNRTETPLSSEHGDEFEHGGNVPVPIERDEL
jgi:hypothetical protein